MSPTSNAITLVLQSEAAPPLDALRRQLAALAARSGDRVALSGACTAAQSLHALAQLAEHALLVRSARALHEYLSTAERGEAAIDAGTVAELETLLALCGRTLSFAGTALEHAEAPAELLAFEARLAAVRQRAAAEAGDSPPVAAAAPCDARLLSLFREDLASCSAQIGAQLVQLEAASDTRVPLEQLMRAAHSLKGAARAVGIDPLVELAHELEECFVAAQRGQLQLEAAQVDVLLAGSDLLGGLVRVAAADLELELELRSGELHRHALAARTLRTEAPPAREPTASLASGGAAPVAAPQPVALLASAPRILAESAPPLVQPQALAAAVAAQTAPASAPSFSEPPTRMARPLPPRFSAPMPQTAKRGSLALSQAPSAGGARPSLAASDQPQLARAGQLTKPPDNDVPDERAVRVAARSIERLVGLSAEALVQARRTEQFSGAIGQLKQRQAALLDRIELRAEQDGELRAQVEECRRITGALAPALDLYVRTIEDLTGRLYHEALQSRMRPFADAVQTLPRLARDAARRLDKRITLAIAGERTRVDRDVLESLQLPLQHLVRNAIDHGIEPADVRVAAGKPASGSLRIEAHHHAGTLVITVSDDGGGVDLDRLRQKLVDSQRVSAEHAPQLSEGELLSFLFLPGLSTAQRVTDISGRGVGLDVVKSAIEAAGGSVRISSQRGQGTTFHLQLPVTRSVIRALIIEVAGEPYALPLLRVERILKVPVAAVRSIEQRQCIELDGSYVGLVRAHELLESPAGGHADELVVLVIREQQRSFGVVVDRFIGEQDLVVRPLDPRLGKVPNLAAASLLNDGTPVLIVDVDDLLRSIEQLLARGRPQQIETQASLPSARGRVLVVDDSVIVRELHKQMLMGQGYEVSVAVDGMDGWVALQNGAFQLVVSDIDMPRLNGFELVKRIKQDARTRDLPVIIVSYKDREEDRLRGLEAGADYYLTKSSFHDRALLDAVHDLLGGP